MPPSLGPMSAEMGETVSTTGPLGSWGLQRSCQKHRHPHPQAGSREDTPTLPPPVSPSPEACVNREKQQLVQSGRVEEPPDPLPSDLPMEAAQWPPESVTTCGAARHPHAAPPAAPAPRAPPALPEQLAAGAWGCSSPPLPHTLTLEAAVGVAQRDIAAVNDKFDLLQGTEMGCQCRWGPFPASSPTATLPQGAILAAFPAWPLAPPSGTTARAGGPGVPGGWRPRRCGHCPGCC